MSPRTISHGVHEKLTAELNPLSSMSTMRYRSARKPWFTEKPAVTRDQKRRAVSLFSGCGGFCEGIEQSGFEVACAVELDAFACQTYRHNFPGVPLFAKSVTEFLKPSPAKHVAEFGLTNIDLVFGGPPCQGFSQIGPRDLSDHRNVLYEEYARVVTTLKPRVFLMENVPNLVLMNRGQFRDAVIRKFQSIGYRNTVFLKIKASDFGVPQDRYRIIFVGTRDDEPIGAELANWCDAFLNQLKVRKPFTVWDAIGDLPANVVHSGLTMPYPKSGPLTTFQRLMRLDRDCGVYSRSEKRKRGIGHSALALHNHHTKEIQQRRMELIAHLRPGFKGDSLPREIWNGLRPEKWRRLHPDKPAYTILAQMHRDLSEWVHPNLERWITVREAARLQSFHDGFVFVGSEWQQLKQIGNAVPPLMASVLGRMAGGLIEKMQNPERAVMGALLQHDLFVCERAAQDDAKRSGARGAGRVRAAA
jgi:DNA (cytosine-5)-methyltransferase 1